MNPLRAIFIWALLLACILWTMVSCVTETTRTITTDKSGTVHDVTTTRKGSDPAALRLVSVAAEIYLPRRPLVIREDKSATPADLRRILRGRPITRQEIATSWKPAAP
jgi:hypothetical protein